MRSLPLLVLFLFACSAPERAQPSRDPPPSKDPPAPQPPTSPPAVGVCTADRWCWASPWPQGQVLNAVWGASANDVVAVGAAGTVIRFDGTSWSGEASGTDATLYAVWGRSAQEIYAAGEHGTILRWDGARWSEESNA